MTELQYHAPEGSYLHRIGVCYGGDKDYVTGLQFGLMDEIDEKEETWLHGIGEFGFS